MTDIELRKQIVNLVGTSDYKKGQRYPKYYINNRGHEIKEGKVFFYFKVESESSYRYYDTSFYKQGDMIAYRCTCPQFYNFECCKHIAACLCNHGREIFTFDLDKLKRQNSLEVLKSFFVDTSQSTIGAVKKELTLDITLEFTYSKELELKAKIGKDKTYILKKKLGDFLQAYKSKQGTVEFGKNFIYDPKTQYFNKKDAEIIDFIYDTVAERYSVNCANNYTITLSDRKIKAFLKIL